LWNSELNVLPPTWICSSAIYTVPGDLYLFSFLIAQLYAFLPKIYNSLNM